VFLDELDVDAALDQLLHQPAQVIEVARQAIHAVHDDGIALAHESQQRLELGPLRVLARGLVGEDPIDRDLLQLTLGVLLEAADSDVTDALSLHGALR
jgi:hypothetical protein